MDIRPIKTPADYKAALKIVESLMDARADSPDGDRLDVLVTLIESYERKRFPMDLPDAATAIKFRMQQQGLTAKDLQPMIGRSNRVYEVLNGKRGLTLAMIRKLHLELNIPAESLIGQAVGPATSVAEKRGGYVVKSRKAIAKRDAARNIGVELIQAVRDIKSGLGRRYSVQPATKVRAAAAGRASAPKRGKRRG